MMTKSTPGMSRPLAATSVATSNGTFNKVVTIYYSKFMYTVLRPQPIVPCHKE